jgi:hypothetical protein
MGSNSQRARTHVLASSSNSFVYREFAFALVSLVAGAYALHEGLLIDTQPIRGAALLQKRPWCVGDSSGHRGRSSHVVDFKLLPLFAAGVHIEGHAPGSAPAAGMYWLEHVLVAVVDDIVVLQPQWSGGGTRRTDNEERHLTASEVTPAINVDNIIAEAIKFANRTARRTAVHDLVFSQSAVVLFRIAAGGELGMSCPVIDKTEPQPLLPIYVLKSAASMKLDNKNSSSSDTTSTDGRPKKQSDADFVDNAAYAAMINLFYAVARAAFMPNAGVLPDDVLRPIVNEHVALINDGDGANGAHDTYRACITALPAVHYHKHLRRVACWLRHHSLS